MLSPSELAPPPPPSSPGVRVGVPEDLLGADGLPGPSGGCLQPEPVQPFYQPDHHHTGEAHTRRPRRRAQPVICCGDVHLRTESNSVGDGRHGDGNESNTTSSLAMRVLPFLYTHLIGKRAGLPLISRRPCLFASMVCKTRFYKP